uniref:Uncharacterized protein n=1 Tax=uncultured bacterium CSL144 TaxID=1091570 RepID=G4WVQ0_9BACT|nr:hypothetical protein [uncultured bacterium CSL144]
MDNGAAAQPAEIAEVTERLSKYDNAETTSELYDFGKLLLEEGVDRAHWLDAKASVMAGFSGGIVALLLLSMLPMWKAALEVVPSTFRVLVFAGIICLLLATISSFLSLMVQKFEWVDEDKVWLAPEYLDFPDLLRRYYLIAMYRTTVARSKGQAKSELVINCPVALA